MKHPIALVLLAAAAAAVAEERGEAPAAKTLRVDAPSTFAYTPASGDEDGVIDITNVTYDATTSFLAGRPKDDRLLLRTTVRTRDAGEPEVDGTVTIEAWLLGPEIASKPLYTINQTGVAARREGNEVLVVDRGVGDVSWWSLFALATGAHLLDTYVPHLRFSLSREIQTMRYAGLDVPPDDDPDARRREPHVVGILAYASGEKVLRRVLLTHASPARAAVLRSYFDTERELTLQPATGTAAPALQLAWSGTFPSPPGTIRAVIPLKGDDLDLAHARLPQGMRAEALDK